MKLVLKAGIFLIFLLKKNHKLPFPLLLCFLSFSVQAQVINIKGTVKDSKSKENLIGATVQQQGQVNGGITNNYGVYHLVLQNEDSIRIVIRSIGYRSLTTLLIGKKDTVIDFFLDSEATTLENVEIIGHKDNLIGVNTNIVTLPLERMKEMPALVGEVDIVKSFQFLPGIQGGKEGTSGLFVRGGSPDQNLILLDDVPIYSINHIGGFFSVFDPNALKSVQLLKGSFPARYGGRLSSILDVRLKEGNKQEHKNILDVGLLSVRYAHEGPIKKDTSSFLFSIRRANLDIFAGIASLLATDGLFRAGYTFYDVNTKYHHILSDKDQVYVSFYGGFDRSFYRQKDSEISGDEGFKSKAKNIVQWGNLLGSFRWSHIYGNNMFSNVTLATTNYHYYNKVDIQRISETANNPVDMLQMAFKSYVKDWIAKIDFEYFPNINNTIRFGSSFTHHDFNPGNISSFQKGLDLVTIDTLYGSEKQRGIEWQAYVENQTQFSRALSINGGIHLSSYLSGEKVYINPQPRILASYKVDNGLFFNASISKMVQYLHLLSNPGTGVPIDLWVPVTDRIKPQTSWMYSIGSSKEIWKEKAVFLTIDMYYKNFSNIIEFSEGASFFGGVGDWQDKVENNGIGRAIGMEMLLEKKVGKTSGWLSYTLAKNERKFESINNNEYFPYRYDRRHNLSLVINHKFNSRISTSTTWQYTTGDAITLTEGQYDLYVFDLDNESTLGFQYLPAHIYSSRNGYRVQAFHRLDLGLNFYKETKKHFRTFRLSVYNVYNRLNPYFLYFNNDGSKTKLFKVSLFPIMPSFSWTWEFK